MKVLVAEGAGVPAVVGRVAGRVEGNWTRGIQTGAKIENVRVSATEPPHGKRDQAAGASEK